MSPVKKPIEFKDLLKEWYDKLNQSGFSDIEEISQKGDPVLKKWDSFYFSARYPSTIFHAKSTYYYVASHFLENHHFEDDLHKRVWRFHAEGISFRGIANLLDLNKDSVSSIVTNLKNEMKKQLIDKYV